MKKLINDVDQVVVEQLQGMAAAHPELQVNTAHARRGLAKKCA